MLDNSPEAINAYGKADYFSRSISEFVPGIGSILDKEIPQQETEEMSGSTKPDLSITNIINTVKRSSPTKSRLPTLGDEVNEALVAAPRSNAPSALVSKITAVGDEQEPGRVGRPQVMSDKVASLRGRTVGRRTGVQESAEPEVRAPVTRVIERMQAANTSELAEEGIAGLEALAENAYNRVTGRTAPSVPIETEPTSLRTRMSPMKSASPRVSPTKPVSPRVSPVKSTSPRVSPVKPVIDEKAARVARIKAAAAEKLKAARIARAKAAAAEKIAAARAAREAAAREAEAAEAAPVTAPTRRQPPTRTVTRPVANVPEQVENPPPKTNAPVSTASSRAAVINAARSARGGNR